MLQIRDYYPADEQAANLDFGTIQARIPAGYNQFHKNAEIVGSQSDYDFNAYTVKIELETTVRPCVQSKYAAHFNSRPDFRALQNQKVVLNTTDNRIVQGLVSAVMPSSVEIVTNGGRVVVQLQDVVRVRQL